MDLKKSDWKLNSSRNKNRTEERKHEDLEMASLDEVKTEFVNFSEIPLPRGRSTNKMDVEGYVPEKYPMNPLVMI